MSKMTAEQKVADFLVQMSMVSKSQGYSSAVFKISMLRSDIALAIETVSRIFKDFQNKGIIRAERHQVSIDNFAALNLLLECDATGTVIKAATISQELRA